MKKIEDRRSGPDYLKLPYTRLLVLEEDGTYRAEVAEFPGCLATGETEIEALTRLSDVAESWIESMLATGQKIPPPQEVADFSGKLMLRMPKSLHRKAAFAAERDGVSLNQFIANSVAEAVGTRSLPSRPIANVQIFFEGEIGTALGSPERPSLFGNTGHRVVSKKLASV